MNSLGLNGLGVEIGCYDGWFASAILNTWNGRKLYLVDAWKPYNDPENTGAEGQLLHFMNAVNEMDKFGDRACIIRDKSEEASTLFAPESLDFVYIDADHTQSGICKDLACWFPKVKWGGVVSGHDYFDGNRYGFDCRVKTVVDEFFAQAHLPVEIIDDKEVETSWLVLKK